MNVRLFSTCFALATLGSLSVFAGKSQSPSPLKRRVPTTGFVQVKNHQLEVNGAPYRFVGTNFWYGMNLGADIEPTERDRNRARLGRELDRLAALGVNNLRVMA